MWDPVDTISVLELDLGLRWEVLSAHDAPIPLGDLPVDGCGMALGGAVALDSWVGFLHNKRSVDV